MAEGKTGFGVGARRLAATRATPAQMAVHNNFKTSVHQLRRNLLRSIYFLKTIREHRIHLALGYATIREYAAREAGLGPRQCSAFLALGRRLGRLPNVSAQLESGRLSWRQAEEISRIATRETETEWIEAAAGLTARQLERRVRAAREAVSRSGAALQGGAAQQGGTTPQDDSIPQGGTAHIQAVAPRSAGTAPAAPSRPLPQIDAPRSSRAQPADTPHYMTFKFTTEQYAVWEAWMATRRSEDTRSTKEALLCAALAEGEGGGKRILRTVLELCPECGRAMLPTSRGDFVAPRALLERAACEGELQHEDGRVERIVPPRLRRRVLARDGHRCRARGCRHTRHLQIHHVKPRAAGGVTVAENLVTLCAACHRRLHAGELELEAILGEAP